MFCLNFPCLSLASKQQDTSFSRKYTQEKTSLAMTTHRQLLDNLQTMLVQYPPTLTSWNETASAFWTP
jgi:hypothetical protein